MTPEIDRIVKHLNATANCARTVVTKKGPDGKPLLDANNKEIDEKFWHAQIISNANGDVLAEAKGDNKLDALEKAAAAAREKFSLPGAPLTSEQNDAQWKSSIESAVGQLQAQIAELRAIVSDAVGGITAPEPVAASSGKSKKNN